MFDVTVFCKKHNPHVVCVLETWLCSGLADTLVSIPNYRIIRVDREDDAGYGGVAMYVRNDVTYRRLHVNLDNAYEGIWLSV